MVNIAFGVHLAEKILEIVNGLIKIDKIVELRILQESESDQVPPSLLYVRAYGYASVKI